MTSKIPPSRATLEPARPDPEVAERPKRRRFTAEYQLAILREADACTERGQLGALLRREGLYSSHITTWRQQRDQGALASLNKRRGRKPTDPVLVENARLTVENERLTKKLNAAQMVIDVQKKVSALLGISLEGAEPEITR